MKLFIYNGLKNNGKQAFQKLEITEEDANRWVQIDLEKRRQENGDDVAPRTPQEIVDEICKEAYDSDRRYRNIKADITTDHGLVEHNGDEESLEDKMERIPDAA